MKIAYETDEEGEIPVGLCFEKEEVECMEMQCKKLEGKTEKQKNPYKNLAYATPPGNGKVRRVERICFLKKTWHHYLMDRIRKIL